MSRQSIYLSRAGLTRCRGLARAAAALLLAAATAGCSLPVSIPLGPLGGVSGKAEPEPEITGSIGPDVDEEGISSRVGAGVWPALRRAVAAAVERGEDGQTFPWRSETHGMTGTVTSVSAYFAESGVVCRRLAITAARSDLSDVFVAEACRNGRDGWSVVPSRGEV